MLLGVLSSLSLITNEPVVTAVETRATNSSGASISDTSELVNLNPEISLQPAQAESMSLQIDAVVQINCISFQLFDSDTEFIFSRRGHGIARFGLFNSCLRLKSLATGALEMQIIVGAFSVINSRPGETKFRDIVPIAKHGRNQFMLLYSRNQSAGSAMVVITIDSPNMIFALDPIFGLVSFFSVASVQASDTSASQHVHTEPTKFQWRLDIHNVCISVLETDTDPASHAIQLTIHQMSISQQVVLFTHPRTSLL